MLVVQWPSLPHHIPFIVVVGLCWPALFSLEPSLKLKAKPLYPCVIKRFMCFGKARYMAPCWGYKNTTEDMSKTDKLLKQKPNKRWYQVDNDRGGTIYADGY